MNNLKIELEKVFALARQQKVNDNPMAETDLIALINLKIDLFKQLDKVPKEKEPKK